MELKFTLSSSEIFTLRKFRMAMFPHVLRVVLSEIPKKCRKFSVVSEI